MTDEEEEVPLPKLMGDLERISGAACARCARALCGHEALVAIVLGHAARPRCVSCVAAGLGTDTVDLTSRIFAHVRRRECYSKGFAAASEREGFGARVEPVCVFAAALAPAQRAPEVSVPIASSGAPPASNDRLDAGDRSCGELVMELFMRLKAAPRGTVLALRATDVAAPLDIPAWCSLTGNRLVYAAPPEYVIAKKEI